MNVIKWGAILLLVTVLGNSDSYAIDERYRNNPLMVRVDYEVDPDAVVKITCTGPGDSCIIEVL